MAAKGSVNVEQMMHEKDMDQLVSKLQRKILQRRHQRCRNCGGPGSFQSLRIPSSKDKPQVYLSHEGILACWEIRCEHCDNLEVITSSDMTERDVDKRLRLSEFEIEYYSQKVEHREVLHDLLELLHIAALPDATERKEQHAKITCFVMRKVKVLCEEWCKPENMDVRYKKFLTLYRETVVRSDDKPDFAPDVSGEYRDLYQMLKSSFHSNKTNVELLLCLMKETLFDNPNVAGFMMWVKIAFMHADRHNEFEAQHYDYANINNKAYDNLMNTFMALEIPVGLKKIPVVFMLFELPRFYYYIEFYNRRCKDSTEGRSPLTEEELKTIRDLEVHMHMLKERESGLKLKEPSKDKFRELLEEHLRSTPRHTLTSMLKSSPTATPTATEKKEDGKTSVSEPKPPLKVTQDTGKMDDLDVSIQSALMAPFQNKTSNESGGANSIVTPHPGEDLSKCISSSKVKELDPQKGILTVYDQITFKYTDNDGSQKEAVLMQTEPEMSKIIGYSKETFRLADLSKYRLEPIEAPKKPFNAGTFTIEIGKDHTLIPTKIEPLSAKDFESKLPEGFLSKLSKQFAEQTAANAAKREALKEAVQNVKPPSQTVPDATKLPPQGKPVESVEVTNTAHDSDSEDKAPSDLLSPVSDSHSSISTDKPLSIDEGAEPVKTKSKSKKPHFKYGTKWRKNKSTYNVDEVSDDDSEKEEEYTYYPCKLLSEYVESQNIVETAHRDLPTGVISLTQFLSNQNIHPSLWTIKKKYIQNELFVILDMARDSDNTRLPLVSASNNRGVSVPVLPILNPSADSSALDLTIGSLYGIQVAHKLSKKQRNVFQRYIRIAVARTRHPELFDNISLGAIKYVKTNDKRVEVKLSVKDMQYEARNEEESERRKIIRLLKKAGAEQDSKKKDSITKHNSTEDSELKSLDNDGSCSSPDESTPTSVNAIEQEYLKKVREPSSIPESFMERKITLKVDRNGKIKGHKPDKKGKQLNKRSLQIGKEALLSSKEFRSSVSAARNHGCDVSVDCYIEGETKESTGGKKKHKISKEKLKPPKQSSVNATIVENGEHTTSPPPPPANSVEKSSQPSSKSSTPKPASKVTFRDKFNTCSYCDKVISDRIRICSGCRKVSYCDSKCQKSHWKVHKKKCFYALSKDMKDTTG